MKNKVIGVALTAWLLLAGPLHAEVVHLVNGDIIHGELVSANNTTITLETKYGKLLIPKEDILRIGNVTTADAASEEEEEADEPEAAAGAPASVSLTISGRSFWYAFDSPADDPADTTVRLRVFLGTQHACTFDDQKPDTKDGSILYNSFTFSETDATLVEAAVGHECAVQRTEDGNVWLSITLPPDASTGERLVRMVYEINAGEPGAPRWEEAISRSFTVQVAPGRQSVVALQQNASALEYTGLFKKSMKNLELFQLSVLSSELKD